MTENKPIMINGVDVSKCIFYQVNFEEDFDVKIKHFCSNWHNSCESDNNSNCYFKQLTRKTQECEQAEQKLEQIKNICHRKADGLWSQTNPLKEILQIIGEVE